MSNAVGAQDAWGNAAGDADEAESLPFDTARRYLRLSWCLPAVFGLGVSAIAICWVVFAAYHPYGFDNTLPSISETAAVPPGSTIFQPMMIGVALCAFVWWHLNVTVFQLRISRLPDAQARPIRAWSRRAYALALIATVSLILAVVIKLHDELDIHVELSALLYTSQVLAFIADSIALLWLRRTDAGKMTAVWARPAVAAATIAIGLFFGFLYFGRGMFDNDYFAQQLYVSTEYLLATLGFAYPLAAFPDTRKFFRLATQGKPNSR